MIHMLLKIKNALKKKRVIVALITILAALAGLELGDVQIADLAEIILALAA